jgi:hypothetical protein
VFVRGVTRGPDALGKRSKKCPLKEKGALFCKRNFFDVFLSETIVKACFKPKIFIVFCRKSCFIINKKLFFGKKQ